MSNTPARAAADTPAVSLSAEDARALLSELLDIAVAMLVAGAEINRVEDTLMRLGRAYGAARMEVFVITSSVIVTMVFPDGQEQTQTRRVNNVASTDFRLLEEMNALSRRCCARPLPPAELHRQLQALLQAPVRRLPLYLGSALGTGSLTVFFGGSLTDALAAALVALGICLLKQKLAPLCLNLVVFDLLAALLSGLGICGLCALLPTLHADKVMIGDIMLLIPGLAMTNALRDILAGDTIAGLMRLIESLLWAGILACGFMIAIRLTGG